MNLLKSLILKLVVVYSIFQINSSVAQPNFTADELQWIKDHPIINTAGGPDWAPFDFALPDKSGSLQHQGISHDILAMVAKVSGLKFNYQINDWDTNLNIAKNSKLFLLPVLNYTPERANYLDYSDAYLEVIQFFFVRNDLSINSINDLNGYTVAIPKSFSYELLFKQQYPQITVISTKNMTEAIIAVLEGRADMLYDSYTVLTYILKQYGIATIVPFKASTIVPDNQLYMAVSKNNPLLIAILNKSLTTIGPNKKNAIMAQWGLDYTLNTYENHAHYQLFYWFALSLLLLAAIAFIWVKTLSKKIKQTQLVQQELTQEKSNLQILFENSVDGHLIYQDNAFKDCNQTVIDMLGYKDKQSFLGQELIVVIDSTQPNGEDSLVYIQTKISECYQSKHCRFEYLAKNKQDEKFWIDVILSLITYNGKNAIHVTWRDISEQKKLAKKLIKAQQKADDANQAKSEFLANMSHEIRTPMNAIVGFTDLLSQQVNNPKHKSFLTTIKQAANSLLTLINDILDLSKVEAGKLKQVLAPTNPYELFNDICQLFSVNMHKKDLRFEVYIDNKFPECLIMEATYIRQVLLNLLSNALKFTDKGVIKFSARVGNIDEHLSKIELILTVEDTGIGIPSDQYDRIFYTFQQQQGQDISKYQGTGLGLSISKKLVELMGGTITVTSKIDTGSKFVVRITNIDIASVAITAQQISANYDLSQKNNFQFNPATILIADDIDYNRELIVQIFNNTRITVVEAENGKQAVEIVNSEPIDLVIMDIRMPVMDGYQASKKINQLYPNIPIIALTASTLESNQNYEASLFAAYISKPVEQHVLLDTLKEFLSHSTIQPQDKTVKIANCEKTSQTNISAVIEHINNKATFYWHKSIESNHINDMTDFLQALEAINAKHPLPLLTKYINNFHQHIEIFDIAGMQESLIEFETLKENIQNIVN